MAKGKRKAKSKAPAHPPAVRDGLPAAGPDHVEEEGLLDNIVPTHGYESLPIIGIGGSAGSIPALQRFFEALPDKPDVAIVVVLHLSPDHESIMPSLLARWTKLRVLAAEDGVKVEPNCVYVIPPGKHLSSVDGHLQLSPLEPERGRRIAVDLFLRSLADTHGRRATAIILSGADSDGAIGIKRIKERGGLTVAQEPEEAEHHGMPQSAIATGMVDWVMPAGEMPARILQYIQREQRLNLPPEEGPPPAEAPSTSQSESEAALREVLAFLRARTGRDFSYYKRATIVRRISRRMQINAVDDLPGYLSFLRTHPGESSALLQDLLISVTNFFRDREAFEALEAMIPELFRGKSSGDMLRVWVPACATGEEAYSMAMLLMEYARKLDSAPGLQVFGCDLDESAIQVARAGLYPETITADVSEERIRRFFNKEPRGYRVRREVREMVLFAAHDLLKDAPFSRMDLVSCRNLLIYLNRDAQKRALDIFHFALRPNGLLFLGSSESVEDGIPLFEVLDKKHRLYRHRAAQKVGLPVPIGPGTLIRALEAQHEAHRGPVLPSMSFSRAATHPSAEPGRGNENLSLAELHFRLVERFAPPSVVVNVDYEVMHLSEMAGKFLQFAGGEPTTNLLKVVHPMLRVELRAALFQAAETSRTVELQRVPIEIDGGRRAVNLQVSPARELAPGYLLVTFEMTEPGAESGAGETHREPEPVVRQLEREIEVMKVRLRDTVEQYEANTEELKASNEELQAMNEELRSASEELETSREELQSINEELATVNQELKSKIEELSHTNSDLHNLMGATDIATVFLDRDLCIKRYTPSAVGLFRMIPSDIGRPLADLRHQLEYPEMTSDATGVLENLMQVEREVRAGDFWYLARLLPYRTLDDRIAGVVLAFVDITESKRAAEALSANEEQFHRAIEDAPIPVIMHAEDGQVLQISRAWTELTGYKQEDIPTFDAWLNRAYGPGANKVRDHVKHLFRGVKRQLNHEMDVATRQGERRRWSFSASAPGTLRDGRRFIVGMALDVTERVEELREANKTLRELSKRLVQAQETERRRIAETLHDDVGQVLTGLKIVLKRARQASNSGELAEADSLVGDLLERVRGLSMELRPHILDNLGLGVALRWHAKRFTQQTRIPVALALRGIPRDIENELAITAFRIIQEALTNIARHSGAKRASVNVTKRSKELRIEVRDDGSGFDPDKPRANASGIAGMRERARLAGGEFEITSRARHGTAIQVTLPLSGGGVKSSTVAKAAKERRREKLLEMPKHMGLARQSRNQPRKGK